VATRGRFGRLPAQPNPSLTNTIVAIAREMQQTRDSNVMDAWKNGGNFEGKPVTDEVVLDHWRERMANISKDDPLYDTYSETVTQLEYTIAESKISTRYAQGKASAASMVAFYTNWAKKIPVDSEFHRVLERNAAQFAKVLAAQAKAAAKKAPKPLSPDVVARVQNEVPGMYLTNVLTNIARGRLVIAGDEGLDKIRLGAEENDPGAMLAIINEFNTSPQFNQPYTDTTGRLHKMSYHDEVMADLHRLDPTIGVKDSLTLPMYTTTLQKQGDSLDTQIWVAQGRQDK